MYGQKTVRWVPGKGSGARVCDRCTEKKIKCDMNRPRCSACDRSNQTCTFSRTRKRPGPPRGSQRQSNNVVEPDCFNGYLLFVCNLRPMADWYPESSSTYNDSRIAPILHPSPGVFTPSSFLDSATQATRIDAQGTAEFLDLHCSLFHSKRRSEL
jgi:hypothetical protein